MGGAFRDPNGSVTVFSMLNNTLAFLFFFFALAVAAEKKKKKKREK